MLDFVDRSFRDLKRSRVLNQILSASFLLFMEMVRHAFEIFTFTFQALIRQVSNHRMFQCENFPTDRSHIEAFAKRLRPAICVGHTEQLPKSASRYARAQVAVDMLRKCPKGLICIKVNDKAGLSVTVPIHWSTQARHHKPETSSLVLKHAESDHKTNDRECVVCLERATDVVLGACNHEIFCQQCLSETLCGWPKGYSAPTCPVCRTPMDSFIVLT